VPDDVAAMARALDGGRPFDPDRGASPLARRARARLCGVAACPRPVEEVARALRVAPETITRSVRAAYGLTPKRYLHLVRVSDAVRALLAGHGVLQSGLDAGFGDASRFYDVFGRVTRTTPGDYAALQNQQRQKDQKSRRRPARGRLG